MTFSIFVFFAAINELNTFQVLSRASPKSKEQKTADVCQTQLNGWRVTDGGCRGTDSSWAVTRAVPMGAPKCKVLQIHPERYGGRTEMHSRGSPYCSEVSPRPPPPGRRRAGADECSGPSRVQGSSGHAHFTHLLWVPAGSLFRLTVHDATKDRTRMTLMRSIRSIVPGRVLGLVEEIQFPPRPPRPGPHITPKPSRNTAPPSVDRPRLEGMPPRNIVNGVLREGP